MTEKGSSFLTLCFIFFQNKGKTNPSFKHIKCKLNAKTAPFFGAVLFYICLDILSE